MLATEDQAFWISVDGETSIEGKWEFDSPNIYYLFGIKVLVYPQGSCWLLETLFHSEETCPCQTESF